MRSLPIRLSLLPLVAQTRTISRADLRDKVEGGWAGQMIGVSFGAPTEFRFKGQLVPLERLPRWRPEMVSNSLRQDDLYVDMRFAKVLDDKGLDATTEDFGILLRDASEAFDGKLDRAMDVCSGENSNRGGEAVWHAFHLRAGKHTLRLVVDGKPGPGSFRDRCRHRRPRPFH